MKLSHLKIAAVAALAVVAASSQAALNAYLVFKNMDGTPVRGPSQVVPNAFEIQEFSFDLEQALSMSPMGARGAAAGKVTFNPFSFSMPSNSSSSAFLTMLCDGSNFKTVTLYIMKASGQGTKPVAAETYIMGTASLTGMSVSGSSGDDTSKVTYKLTYGQLAIGNSSDPKAAPTGWDRVTNRPWTSPVTP